MVKDTGSPLTARYSSFGPPLQRVPTIFEVVLPFDQEMLNVRGKLGFERMNCMIWCRLLWVVGRRQQGIEGALLVFRER